MLKLQGRKQRCLSKMGGGGKERLPLTELPGVAADNTVRFVLPFCQSFDFVNLVSLKSDFSQVHFII